MHNRQAVQNEAINYLISGEHSEYILRSDFNMEKTQYYSV